MLRQLERGCSSLAFGRLLHQARVVGAAELVQFRRQVRDPGAALVQGTTIMIAPFSSEQSLIFIRALLMPVRWR